MLRIGLIGLDTSHVPGYAHRLNDPHDPEYVPGAKVVAGFPGASKDIDLSISRVEIFTNELRGKFGVQIMDSPEAVAEAVDLVFITSVDGRRHLEFFKQIAKFKRPTYIDKPMATTVADAKEIFRIAEEGKFPVASCSSLRFADSLSSALAEEHGPILGCDVFGPMPEQAQLPGLFWYGIHCVEVMNVIMGRGCKQVRAFRNAHFDLITAAWADGRIATIRGLRAGHSKFGATIHRDSHSVFVDLQNNKKSWYTRLLETLLATLPNGKAPIEPAQTLEIMRFIEAANESRTTGNSVIL